MEGSYIVEIHEKIAELESRLKMAEVEKNNLNTRMGMLSRENDILLKAMDNLYKKEKELNEALSKILLLEHKLHLLASQPH
jgi:chromosome segregation ATPase